MPPKSVVRRPARAPVEPPRTRTRPLVSVEELAEYLSVSPWWVRGHVTSRTVPFIKVGKHLRFDLDRIDAWVEENSFEPGSA